MVKFIKISAKRIQHFLQCCGEVHNNSQINGSIQQVSIILILLQAKMPTTCLICFQEAEYFLLPPCNHKQMCWKCCIKLVEDVTFTCPFCNDKAQGTSSILFVNQHEMKNSTFQQILNNKPFKSAVKPNQLYSNEEVAKFIEEETSFYCRLCSSVFNNMNYLKKHLNQVHRKQFCEQCLQNRKCLLSEQYLYSEGELTAHLKKGQYSQEHELILYHPWCDFCKSRYYDIDAFRAHLRISTHLKCQICEKNFPKLKYVYYKDFNQIEKHFYKSHYVCDIGACIGNKLQNVFVSQHLLEEHKNRFHNKGGSRGNQKPIVNLLLFQQNLEEQFQWDKIGKDFTREFMIVEKSYTLKNQEHRDTIIDIRAFYPELTKSNNKVGLDQIQSKLEEYLFRSDYKSQIVNFTSVPIFTPLEMSSLSRFELQKFLRSIYEPKYSEAIIEIFFTRKFQYRSEAEYFSDVRRKMWLFSPISYFYVFPQLIRFFKDTNRTKITMDDYYAQTLRSLKINRHFIFHTRERYTDILNIMQDQIEQYIYEQMLEQKIDLQKYQKYLKDLNPEYYNTVHSDLFYVQKQKIKNMFHMIEKTRTNELLKLNWLLKLGLCNSSFKAIYDNFFYKTVDDCNGWMACISLQELALVYAYVEICLVCFVDQGAFSTNKSNPHTLFLGSILSKIKTCISPKQLTALRQLQQKSVELAAKLNSFVVTNKKKGIVINEEQHPSLLSQGGNKQQKIEENLFLFGQNVSLKPNSNIRVNRKNNKNKDDVEEFPELFPKKQKEEDSKFNEEDEFPVFNYKHKQSPQDSVKKKKSKANDDQRSNIEKLQLFNPKNAFVSKKICQQFYEKKDKERGKQTKEKQEDEWPTLTDKSLQLQKGQADKQKNTKKKKKKQVEEVAVEQVVQKQEPAQIPQQMFIKKKTKQELKAEEQQGKLKKIKERVNKQYIQQAEKPKQPEQKPVQNVVKQKRKKVRLDATDSEQEERNKKFEKQKLRQQKHKAFIQEQRLKQSLKYHEGFDSLLDKNKSQANNVSIINSLIKQSKAQETETEVVIKKGKKGKAIVIEKVDFWKL